MTIVRDDSLPDPCSPVRQRSATRALLLAASVLAMVAFGPSVASATTPPPDETLLTMPGGSEPEDSGPPDTATPSPTTTNDFLDTERDLDECIGNSNARPGCGRKPVRSGDRGGWMQWTVFGVMAVGIGFIGWRIVSGARNRPAA